MGLAALNERWDFKGGYGPKHMKVDVKKVSPIIASIGLAALNERWDFRGGMVPNI